MAQVVPEMLKSLESLPIVATRLNGELFTIQAVGKQRILSLTAPSQVILLDIICPSLSTLGFSLSPLRIVT